MRLIIDGTQGPDTPTDLKAGDRILMLNKDGSRSWCDVVRHDPGSTAPTLLTINRPYNVIVFNPTTTELRITKLQEMASE